MNKVVLITTDSKIKKEFAWRMHEMFGDNFCLTVILKEKEKKFYKRISDKLKNIGFKNILKEVYALILNFLNYKSQDFNNIAKLYNSNKTRSSFPDPLIVYEYGNYQNLILKLESIKPDLIAIWGGIIVPSSILRCAPVAVNMHLGFCPIYRGANAIQHTIINKDFANIAYTIHYAEENVDSGHIISTVKIDQLMPPKKYFTILNEMAMNNYLKTIQNILNREKIISTPQDLKTGKNYKLRDWSSWKQLQFYKEMNSWNKKYNQPQCQQ